MRPDSYDTTSGIRTLAQRKSRRKKGKHQASFFVLPDRIIGGYRLAPAARHFAAAAACARVARGLGRLPWRRLPARRAAWLDRWLPASGRRSRALPAGRSVPMAPPVPVQALERQLPEPLLAGQLPAQVPEQRPPARLPPRPERLPRQPLPALRRLALQLVLVPAPVRQVPRLRRQPVRPLARLRRPAMPVQLQRLAFQRTRIQRLVQVPAPPRRQRQARRLVLPALPRLPVRQAQRLPLAPPLPALRLLRLVRQRRWQRLPRRLVR